MENKQNIKKEIIELLLDELEKRKLIKNGNAKSSYERTKQVLYDYNRLKKSKNNLEKQIKRLESSKNSNDMQLLHSTDFSKEIKGINITSNLDTINNRIHALKEDIKIIECFLLQVDDVLSNLSKADYDLINNIYISKIKVIDLSVAMNCDSSTIYRNINKIINEQLKIELFPIFYINENN